MVLSPVLGKVLTDPPADPLGIIIPSQLAGLKLWARYNQGITVTGLGVSQWDDQSGNGNHLLQATDANRPSKEADGSILFNGLAHFLKAAAFTLVQPETIYILGKQVTWENGTGYIFDGNTKNSGLVFQTSATPKVTLHAGLSLNLNSDWILDTYAALTAIINGASSSLKFDNNTAITGNAGANNMGGFTLGASGGSDSWSNIQVREMLVYNTAHNAAERKKIIDYLATVGNLSI